MEVKLALGNVAIAKRDFTSAHKLFDESLKIQKNDYALLQVANMYLNAAQDPHHRESAPKNIKYVRSSSLSSPLDSVLAALSCFKFSSVSQALDYFLSVLKRDPANVYAVNGLAIAMHLKGKTDQARDFLVQVCPFLSLSLINLLSSSDPSVHGQPDGRHLH